MKDQYEQDSGLYTICLSGQVQQNQFKYTAIV
jgi:hypothetical protein